MDPIYYYSDQMDLDAMENDVTDFDVMDHNVTDSDPLDQGFLNPDLVDTDPMNLTESGPLHHYTSTMNFSFTNPEAMGLNECQIFTSGNFPAAVQPSSFGAVYHQPQPSYIPSLLNAAVGPSLLAHASLNSTHTCSVPLAYDMPYNTNQTHTHTPYAGGQLRQRRPFQTPGVSGLTREEEQIALALLNTLILLDSSKAPETTKAERSILLSIFFKRELTLVLSILASCEVHTSFYY